MTTAAMCTLGDVGASFAKQGALIHIRSSQTKASKRSRVRNAAHESCVQLAVPINIFEILNKERSYGGFRGKVTWLALEASRERSNNPVYFRR